jgi:hypothetical protein
MLYTKLYIGSNNETKELEYDKIRKILATAQQGYTILEAVGVWNGLEEHTAIVEIYGNYNLAIIGELKRELKQDSILVTRQYVDVSFE